MGILDFAITLVGSGLGTALVGAWYKRKIDRELEIQKAYLFRASRVHERQVDVLGRLCGHFTEMQAYLQLMQKAFVLVGENTGEYPKKFVEASDAAVKEFTFGRLLLPKDVVARCDSLFKAAAESRREYAFSLGPLLRDPEERKKFNDRATDLSYRRIPELLESIEGAMRQIVHGRDPATD